MRKVSNWKQENKHFAKVFESQKQTIIITRKTNKKINANINNNISSIILHRNIKQNYISTLSKQNIDMTKQNIDIIKHYMSLNFPCFNTKLNKWLNLKIYKHILLNKLHISFKKIMKETSICEFCYLALFFFNFKFMFPEY